MAKELYADINGISNILSVNKTSSHNSATSVLVVEAESHSIGLGTSITADIGYTTAFDTIFTGYVKQIERNSSNGVYTISAHDEMIRAVDYFLASSTPDGAFTRKNIKAEDLVRALLKKAGLTNYTFEATNFIFATKRELEINLVGIYDFCKQIANILAWHLWADNTGKIHFENRRPHIMAGDTADITITDSSILSSTEISSDRDLRNRVVVYGDGVNAESKVSSPYLPTGFYKTIVLSTDLIDKYKYAKRATNFNLDLYNRLNESVNVKIEGNASIDARQIIKLQDTILGIDDDYYAYGVDHNWSNDGYTVDLVIRK
jgi:hypothetical protein